MKLFNYLKEKLEKRKNNRKKYGSRKPLFAISKKKRAKRREAQEKYNLALNEYFKIKRIIKENMDNYKINEVAINRCFGPEDILNDLLREQEEYIRVLNENQKKLSSSVKEKLEKYSWINRKKMLKPECFHLWIIKKEKKLNKYSNEVNTNDDKLNVDNLNLTKEEKSEYILGDNKIEDAKEKLPTVVDKRARYDIDPVSFKNLQFINDDAVPKKLSSSTGNLRKMIVRFSGSHEKLGNYCGISGILFDGQPVEKHNGIEADVNLCQNDELAIEDKYDECKEEIRGAILDYLTRVNNLDSQYNILEFEGIKNELTLYYKTKISELETEYMINEYRNEYKKIEENYSSYPRFVSVLKETLKEKYENFYGKSLSDFDQKYQNLNDEFGVEIASLNDNYSISQYIEDKNNLESDLSNYRRLLVGAYGKEMVDNAWNEISMELNEKLENKYVRDLTNDNRSYTK